MKLTEEETKWMKYKCKCLAYVLVAAPADLPAVNINSSAK